MSSSLPPLGDPLPLPSLSGPTSTPTPVLDDITHPNNVPSTPPRYGPATATDPTTTTTSALFTRTISTLSRPATSQRRPSHRRRRSQSRTSHQSYRHRRDSASSDDSFERTLSRQASAREPDGWSLEKVLKRQKAERDGLGVKEKRLDLGWRELSVRGVGADAVFADDLGSIFNPLTSRNDKKRAAMLKVKGEDGGAVGGGGAREGKELVGEKLPISSSSSADHSTTTSTLGSNEKYLIHSFDGTLKSGEMCLVLGRPGSGCTTFMKVMSNIRQGYAGVDGAVTYGTMDSKEAGKYPGEIVFCSEDDTHYPDLTVSETISFALKMKTPSSTARPAGISRKEWEADYGETLMKTFGIEHTTDTKVGNESVRGVSGGERKRVTLAEALVNRAPVICFDQPTRGLDASTALEFARSMRLICDYTKVTSFVSIYQAGNQIYDCFDKIMVIAAGLCIYFGPRKDARLYFEEMGFVVGPGANLSDYLTAVTVATERVVAEGKEGSVPNSPEDFAKAYLNSDVRRRAIEEYDDFIANEEERRVRTEDFKKRVQEEKAKRAGKKGPYTTSLWTQTLSGTRRQAALVWNDKASLAIKQGGCAFQSIILGSLFYMLSSDTTGLFTRGGILFLILLVNSLLGLGEVVNSFKGRTILAKHKSAALYRPSALIMAQVLVDLPIVALQVTFFIIPIYFMSQLRQTAGAFFTLWIFTYVSTQALLGFFRMIGFAFSSFQGAGAVSGFFLGFNIITMGFLLPPNQLPPWIGWYRWLNPLFYALESANENEFYGRTLDCVTPSLIPYGQGYPTTGEGVACTVPGSETGQTTLTGEAYMRAQYGYSHGHLWRNLGVIIAYWALFVILTCIAVERLKAAGSQKSILLFRRPAKGSPQDPLTESQSKDEETGKTARSSVTGPVQTDGNDMGIEKTDTIFSWKNLNYTVPVKGGKRQLLNGIQGFTKPGQLVALMGASGAGKTTLLDVLALRKEDGEVEGDILVDGRPLGPSFQRTTGYVSQMDIHEPTQTIREALRFSALLRQPQSVSQQDKFDYVERVIEVLELTELADAVIGVPGAGLSIEQRKRCTIGVELVAKPKLLFLDEPTSGLDGQSAYNILRFLRKLSDLGQSMLVTVHQPSAQLFSMFDQLLLLAKGGKVVFNGPLGEHAQNMKDYFAKNGLSCPEDANPAEFMIDVVSGSLSKGKDWVQIWLDSEEFKQISKEVDEVNQDALARDPSFHEDGLYYAASLGTQLRLVTARAFSACVREPEYVLGRVGLVVGSGLLTGLSYLQLDNDVASIRSRLFAVFNAMFVAPPLFNIIQPHFIGARTLYESREKQSKIYGWFPFVFSVIVVEIPWLLMSCVLHWVSWYLVTFPVGILTSPSHAGAFFGGDLLYFLWIGAFAQFIAAMTPTAEAAALLNSIPIGIFASFSGVLVPYSQLPTWWRYWLYYLNPWSYILGAKVFFVNHNIPITCKSNEFQLLSPPGGQTCGAYLQTFISTVSGYVDNPSATADCRYCQYANGNEYLKTVNLEGSPTGYRNILITMIYVMAFWIFTAMAIWWRNRRA